MLNNKTAIVTGGSRGIGRAIALALAAQNAKVAILYAGNEAAAQATVEEAQRSGYTMTAIRCDVADSDATKTTVAALLKEWGQIDILINCAGITRDGLIMRMKDEDFDSVIATNLKGAFLMTRQCATPMMKRRTGRIINIASVSGLSGNAGQANYSAAKAGMIGLTKSVARELAGRGITCNAIAPGFIETDMTAALSEKVLAASLENVPMNRMGTPEEVASLAVYLCSEGAAYITGEVIRIDGGMCM
ncbi:3-oxoacyl-[acyl-carrier-protein] reductase [Oscillospiraceae bacterium LTW-04]|nr:3-oxoacyl-[acyl-carrier-protein] reductase [Oscillospiraceae bacterium MB24-C1]